MGSGRPPLYLPPGWGEKGKGIPTTGEKGKKGEGAPALFVISALYGNGSSWGGGWVLFAARYPRQARV